jgi:hypothetical protein
VSRKPNANRTARVYLRPSAAVATYLDEIASVGIFGKTRAEVAERLIGSGIAQFLKDGLMAEARRPRNGASRRKR